MAESTNASRSQDTPDDTELSLAKGIDALSELYELLEAHGPAWYSEEVHGRAQTGLRMLRQHRESWRVHRNRTTPMRLD
jgi:hypothetical protein